MRNAHNPRFDPPAPPLVLILAPDWDTGRFLRAHLATHGFDCFIALTITDAMELLQIHLCDVLMVDTSHFGPAALALFQHVRSISADVCLVALGPSVQEAAEKIDAALPVHPDTRVLGLTLAAMLARRERRLAVAG